MVGTSPPYPRSPLAETNYHPQREHANHEGSHSPARPHKPYTRDCSPQRVLIGQDRGQLPVEVLVHDLVAAEIDLRSRRITDPTLHATVKVEVLVECIAQNTPTLLRMSFHRRFVVDSWRKKPHVEAAAPRVGTIGQNGEHLDMVRMCDEMQIWHDEDTATEVI